MARRNIALAVFIAVSAFSLLYPPVRESLTQVSSEGATKAWNFGQITSHIYGVLVANFKSKSELQFENESMLALVGHMQAQVLDRNLLAEKVARLEEILGRTQGDDRVVANVLVGPGNSPYDTLVIDVGAEQGVKIGSKVVYAGSGVIGEIVEVTSATSKVKLYSSPREEKEVIIGKRYTPALAVGKGMGNFETKVPQDSLVAVGDNVILTNGYLIIGTVSLVEDKPSLPFKRVLFRVPFNIAEIRTVEVIQ